MKVPGSRLYAFLPAFKILGRHFLCIFTCFCAPAKASSMHFYLSPRPWDSIFYAFLRVPRPLGRHLLCIFTCSGGGSLGLSGAAPGAALWRSLAISGRRPPCIAIYVIPEIRHAECIAIYVIPEIRHCIFTCFCAPGTASSMHFYVLRWLSGALWPYLGPGRPKA